MKENSLKSIKYAEDAKSTRKATLEAVASSVEEVQQKSLQFGAGDGTRYKRSPYKTLDFDLVGT